MAASLPLSIGIVLHDFAFGGTERIATRLAGRWAAMGATVTIFAGSTDGAMRALLDPRVTVVAAQPPIPRRHGSRRRLARAAARHFQRVPVDVCFLPGNFHWPIAPALARLPRPVRPAIVAQISAALSKPQRPGWKQLFYAWRMRRLLAGASAVIALSSSAAAEAECMIGRAIAHVIPLPALADDGARPVASRGAGVLAAGRLVPEKGFDLLIAAFATIDPPATLTIVGDGPDEARLRGLIASHGLERRVTLPGFVADTRPWLDAARLFVLPSRFEGYPAVLVEAFAAGRAAVATACTPAATDLIDEPALGRVVPIDDLAAMAQAIGEMLGQPAPKPAMLAAKVSQHRIGPVAQAYLDLFARLAR